jgi:hypothetical protein
MMKLAMTSSLPAEKPAVILEHLDDFSNRHDPNGRQDGSTSDFNRWLFNQ